MPIYEYRCQACGQEQEVIQKLSDPVLSSCPACGKPELKKLISAAGFQLKGSGWYATDFKKGGSQKTEKDSSDKAAGDKAAGDKAAGDKAAGDKAVGDKAAGDKAAGDKGSTAESAPTKKAQGGGGGCAS